MTDKMFTLGTVVGRLEEIESKIRSHPSDPPLITAHTWTLFVDVLGAQRCEFRVNDREYAAAAIGQEVLVVVEEHGDNQVVPIELLFELPSELRLHH